MVYWLGRSLVGLLVVGFWSRVCPFTFSHHSCLVRSGCIRIVSCCVIVFEVCWARELREYMWCVALVFGGSGVPTSLGYRSTNNMAEANIPMLFDFRVLVSAGVLGHLIFSHLIITYLSVLFCLELGHVMGKRNCYYWREQTGKRQEFLEF
ncbi:hypothetical protein BDW69DRAFT_11299 [Aspergillus filifer]